VEAKVVTANHRLSSFRFGRRTAFFALLTAGLTWLYAHEGHVALPSRGAQVDAAKGTIILSRESRDALDVRSAEISTQPIPESIMAYATIVSPWQRHAFASSRMAGRISKLNIAPGQSVEAGQVIAAIASPELEILQSEILSAQTDLQLAEQIVAAMHESRGSVAEQMILEAENKRSVARNAMQIGRAKWRGLVLEESDIDALLSDTGKRVASYPVRSPLSGTVIHADLNVGKVVDAGEHLCEIVDFSRVWAKIGVLERDLSRVKTGQAVDLQFFGSPGEVYRSTVQTIGFNLDPQTHLNAVWAEFENRAGRAPTLLPGMSGIARIMIPVPSGTRVIPAAALIDDGLAQYVLVEEARAEKQSEYRRKNVVVIRRTTDLAEVQSNELFPGDRVVTQGALELGGFFVPGVLKLSPEAAKTIGLAVAPVERHTVDDVVEFDGQVAVRPRQQSTPSAQLSGNIQRVLVDRGQSVKAGQLLAEVFSLELKNLQLDLIREQLSLDLLETQSAGLRRVAGAVAKRRILEIDAELNSARFTRDSLHNRLTTIGLTEPQLESLIKERRLIEAVPVRSPVDGVVTSFDKVLGQSVKTEEAIFTVTDLTHPLVEGFVSERDVSRIRLGQTARVRFVSDPSTTWPGHVARSSQVLTPDDQSLSVWIDLDEQPPEVLRVGQLASIAVSVAHHAPVIAVPLSAVWREGTLAYVFVRRPDEVFERRLVHLGRAGDRHVEVQGGLAIGEMVAFRGVPGLQTAYSSIK
jgi:cobalt-zinc-cadmium efflux system membrane fusion protein